jgi:tetratricopeptide (TPR) repeat protein
MNKEETIAKARDLREDDQLEESLETLLPLLEEYDDDPLVLFEVGGAYDILGLTAEAIPYYEQAITDGLQGPELEECFICLGTSYRVLGDYSESIEVLEQARSQFPTSNSAKAFLALALYGNKQFAESVQLLIDILLESTADEDLLSFSDTLEYFKDNLDEVWPA